MGDDSHLIITVSRNDSNQLSNLVKTILDQSLRPCQWIIVDDSSTDDTLEKIEPILRENNWISILRGDVFDKSVNRGERISRLFTSGINYSDIEWDFCSKIDSDMELGREYLADITGKFTSNPNLGIASGNCILLKKSNKHKIEKVTSDHTRGGLKTYRRQCYNEIKGIPPVNGWDTIDNIKAQMEGWETENFSDILALQSRSTGSREGLIKTAFLEGRKCHFLGYFGPYLFARAVHRMFSKYYFICGLVMLIGYSISIFSRTKKYEERDVSSYLRRKQISKLSSGLFHHK